MVLRKILDGVESVIMNYYRNIDRKKIQFDFLCNTETVAYESEIKELGGRIYKITARSKNRKKYKKEMNTFFEQHSQDYSTIWVNVCSLANIDYLIYAKKYGIKKRIIHAHNSKNMDSFLRGILHKLNKLFITRYATDFWSCSMKASKWFYNNKIIQSEKYFQINNAINYEKYKYDSAIRDEYRKKFKIDQNTLVIGNVGRFHFQKNQFFIIKIFNEIHKKVPSSKLILVGDGPDRDNIKSMIKEYNLEDSVLCLGIRKDVAQLMSMMDIFLFPSVFEGLPLTLVEAQASNLLIYASNVISDKVIIDSELIKLISLSENEECWANHILKAKKNNRESIKIKNLIIQKNYDIKTEVRKFERKLEGE